MTIGSTLFGECGRLRRGQVFKPIGGFGWRTGSHVDRQIRLGAYLLYEVHEFMRAESVWLDDAAPIGIQGGRPLVARPNAIAPVILVGEASARPAHVGHLDSLEGLDHVVANPTRVRNLRIRSHPHAFIDAAAEVFGELAEDV